ncbi:hypothetical protein WH47_06689 [Habropoda laboriosa]|uniref:Histone-lysine N-methyltransferase SETMAR n=1 Tax=Habropoda laboriosa TaxID=597456 RepID=A0A0L7QS48_9HYME|nr:hypothetical protein WH47_06689 [Habropoda laboriosa]
MAFKVLHELRYKILSHPPHSPYLFSTRYHIPSTVQKFLSETRFLSDKEVKEAVDEYFAYLDKPDFRDDYGFETSLVYWC